MSKCVAVRPLKKIHASVEPGKAMERIGVGKKTKKKFSQKTEKVSPPKKVKFGKKKKCNPENPLIKMAFVHFNQLVFITGDLTEKLCFTLRKKN